MQLVQRYAQVVDHVPIERFLSFLTYRGHLSLLPRILSAYERMPKKQNRLTVASEKDVKNVLAKFPDHKIVVDKRIVGGYSALTGYTLSDKSYRSALVKLYNSLTH